MFQFLRGIVLIGVIISSDGVVFGQIDDRNEAAEIVVPHCRWSMENRPSDDPFTQGLCAGIVQGIFSTAPAICAPPTGVSSSQKIRVVVQYIESRHARLHESFQVLALEALQVAWPCKQSKPGSGGRD